MVKSAEPWPLYHQPAAGWRNSILVCGPPHLTAGRWLIYQSGLIIAIEVLFWYFVCDSDWCQRAQHSILRLKVPTSLLFSSQVTAWSLDMGTIVRRDDGCWSVIETLRHWDVGRVTTNILYRDAVILLEFGADGRCNCECWVETCHVSWGISRRMQCSV